jgi:hypothetical protein
MRHALATALLFSIFPAPLLAQSAWVGASAGVDVQRFARDAVPNRLEGESLGASILGGVRLFGRIPIMAEWVHAGTVVDTATTTVEINARPVNLTSTFRHRTRGVAVLGGFEHAVGRAWLAYLGGIQLTDVEQRFGSNAASLVLIAPSRPATSGDSVSQHRIVGPAGGTQVTIPVGKTVRLISGARVQRLTMPLDIRGWSVRVYGGAAWEWEF